MTWQWNLPEAPPCAAAPARPTGWCCGGPYLRKIPEKSGNFQLEILYIRKCKNENLGITFEIFEYFLFFDV
jgi:hypothetical protein